MQAPQPALQNIRTSWVHPAGSSLIFHYLTDSLPQLLPSTTSPKRSLVELQLELADLEWKSREWALVSQAGVRLLGEAASHAETWPGP